MTLIALLACSCAQETLDPGEVPPTAFDVRPEGVPLVPSAVAWHEVLAKEGLEEELVRQASELSYRTHVTVMEVAAVRTGAELGVLALEAGTAAPEEMSARAARIRQGVESLGDDEGELVDEARRLELWLALDHPRDELLSGLDERAAGILERLEAHAGREAVPLVLAGAWVQASNLLARAMEARQTFGAGPPLLQQPEVGAYFRTYNASPETPFPDSTRQSFGLSLSTLRETTTHNPMTAEDAARIRETTDGLLDML